MMVVIRRPDEQASEVCSATPPILAFRFAIRTEGLTEGQKASILDTRMFIRLQQDHQTVDMGQTELDVSDNGQLPGEPSAKRTLTVLVRVAPESVKWIAKNVKAEYVDLTVSGSALCLIEPQHQLRWEPIHGEAGETPCKFRIPLAVISPLVKPRTYRGQRQRPSMDPFAILREQGAKGLRDRLNGESIETLRATVRSYVLDPSRRSHKWTNKDKLVELIVARVSGESERGKVFL
jgi:hypothetical protein